MFGHLAYGEDIDPFLFLYDTSVTQEQASKLVGVAKLLVEFYAYKIALERMGDDE